MGFPPRPQRTLFGSPVEARSSRIIRRRKWHTLRRLSWRFCSLPGDDLPSRPDFPERWPARRATDDSCRALLSGRLRHERRLQAHQGIDRREPTASPSVQERASADAYPAARVFDVPQQPAALSSWEVSPPRNISPSPLIRLVSSRPFWKSLLVDPEWACPDSEWLFLESGSVVLQGLGTDVPDLSLGLGKVLDADVSSSPHLLPRQSRWGA